MRVEFSIETTAAEALNSLINEGNRSPNEAIKPSIQKLL